MTSPRPFSQQPPAAGSPGPTRRQLAASGLFVLLATLAVFSPALFNGFVNLDDSSYITGNPNIRSLSPGSLRWMLTSFYAGNWHPLTWLAHAAGYALWGLDAGGHHLTSILFHGANAVLVFLLTVLLVRFARPGEPRFSLAAGCGAALVFSLHPLRVESVAWAAELKDPLCAFFVLLCLIFYLCYASAAAGRRRWGWFGAGLLGLGLALMSKPMAVSVPAALIILDYYPLGRFGRSGPGAVRVLLEKVPFALLSLASCVLTLSAQSAGGAIRNLEQVDLGARAAHALAAAVFYISKTLWPAKLAALYRLPPRTNPLDPPYLLAAAAVISITLLCIWQARKGQGLWAAAWAWYLVSLLPVSGLIQTGIQSAADRYTYLPGLSMALLAGLGAARGWNSRLLNRNAFLRVPAFLCAAAIISILSARTIRQIQTWHNSETLWQAVIRAFPESRPDAYYGLGIYYADSGRHADAVIALERAVALSPGYANARYNLANAYASLGKTHRAAVEFERTVALDPDNAYAYSNLGSCYSKLGRPDDALDAFRQAVRINPALRSPGMSIGILHHKAGRLNEAIAAFRTVLNLGGPAPRLHYLLARAYYDAGDYRRASRHCNLARRQGYNVPAGFLEQLRFAPAPADLQETP